MDIFEKKMQDSKCEENSSTNGGHTWEYMKVVYDGSDFSNAFVCKLCDKVFLKRLDRLFLYFPFLSPVSFLS